MLVDANILLYATDSRSRYHERCRRWIEGALNGSRRVALPWMCLSAFLRITTNPRAMAEPLSPTEAWELVDAWLDADVVWCPEPGPGHRTILRRLVTDLDLRSNLLSDAVLAALCEEHGLSIVSADRDFARFTEIEWINPTVD